MIKLSFLTCLAILLLFLGACNRSEELFTSLPSSKTNISFENKPLTKKAFGILYYLYYYNGGGVATGDINNDGLPDIYFTANSIGNNKLYLNKGNFEFEDITEKAGVKGNSDWCSGVTMADVNGDGFLDIYVSAVANHHRLEGRNELFINNGNGTFTESAMQYGLDFSGFTTQAAFFDYDHDGDLDCYILNQSHKPNENITDTINRRKFDQFSGDRLYRNDLNTTAKKFTDVSATAGIYQSSLGYGLGLAIADFNNDGWEDIYVGNDFHENDYYYLNNGNGTFSESGAAHFEHYSRFSMGNDAADFNNDGQMDIITVDMLPDREKILKTYGSDENPDIYRYKLMTHGFQYQYSKNCLQRNNGSGSSFSEISLIAGVSATDWSWSPLFADFDNDGNKDLFISSGIVKRPVDLDYVRFISNLYNHKALNSTDQYDNQALEKMPDGTSHPFLFKGDGNMMFNDVSRSWGTEKLKGYFTGAAYADLDNDGRLDIVINSLNAPAVVLKNNAPSRNYLSVKFKGEGLNTSGIGAKAYLYHKGKMQFQQLMLTRGFQSSSDSRLHFGLTDSTAIDSLLIIWPDKKYQLILGTPANTFLTVNHKEASGEFNYSTGLEQPHEFFTDISKQIALPWQHKENSFFDNNIQYLIPHSESTRGPKFAVADVNNDGLDDIYACGAKGQDGTLLIQQAGGSFVKSDTAVFNADTNSEDVDAIFFDANGDGHPDLYVVSGGNEYNDNTEALSDRLYMNDGKGHFTKSGSIPAILQNKSCVSIIDYDKDGDQDIFVGTLANAKAFGIPQTSYLLINDGKGNFKMATQDVIDLKNIGMVTTSVSADINKDGWTDLIIAGEWMPITIFINKNGKFEKSTVPNSTGMWQTLFADDTNGNINILAGNWGWNNKFHSGKNGPVRLYVSDFDHNGQTDQLLSYTLNGQEFPFLAKDEVERQLPTLKKHYLKYEEYSGVIMKDVFYGWIDSIKPLLCEKLGSALLINDGKGNFSINELPAALQLTPIFSFEKIGNSMYMAGGNFFDVIPYEGRYDAQPLSLFSMDKNNTVSYIHQPNLSSVKGQVRDIKWLNTPNNEKILSVAINNGNPVFYDLKK